MTIFLTDLTKYINEYLLKMNMPRIITLHEKLSVIDAWLNGESRNDIATKHNIGSGTVYNIVQEWSNEFGDAQQADRLRELAIKLKKNGLTVSDCAKGLRILRMLKKYGIQDDEENQEKVPYFLKEIYATCQEVGLKPQQVFDYISDIIKFSSEISISQIPQYMKKRIEQKEQLESTVQNLFKKINELAGIQMQTEQEIERLSKMKETMTKTYQTFARLNSKLKQYGIEMENIEQFVKCVVGISKENYNHVQIVEKIADYETLEKNSRDYNEQVNRKKDELAKLNQDINLEQKQLNCFKIKLEMINELEMMGFGINEFQILNDMLNEIGGENKLSFDGIRKQFFDDVKNYKEVIRSRMEIDRLKYEVKNLEDQTMKEREKYNAYPTVIEGILRLAGSGINENGIIKIDKILSMTDYYTNKDKPLYKETLIDDLQKYGNLKLVIKYLKETEKDLKSKKIIRNNQMKKKENRYDKK
jgi:hypothetical protein